MYRAASRTALYQGDVLVAPEVALTDHDPRVATREVRKILCGVCKRRVSDKRLCDACGSALPAPDKTFLRITGLGDRQSKGEEVFSNKPEVLVRFKPLLVMLESHSCDIDRQGDVAAWGIRPLDQLSGEQQNSVRKGENTSLLLLEGAGALPPCAVDFNMTLTVPAWSLGEPRTYRSARKGGEEENALLPFEEVVEQRIVSLSPVGLKRVYEAKLRHLTRGVYELDEPVIDPDDPDRPKGPLPRRKWWLPYPPWTKLAAPRGSKTSAGAPAAATPAAVASPASER